jgi:hypothetical protein
LLHGKEGGEHDSTVLHQEFSDLLFARGRDKLQMLRQRRVLHGSEMRKALPSGRRRKEDEVLPSQRGWLHVL